MRKVTGVVGAVMLLIATWWLANPVSLGPGGTAGGGASPLEALGAIDAPSNPPPLPDAELDASIEEPTPAKAERAPASEEPIRPRLERQVVGVIVSRAEDGVPVSGASVELYRPDRTGKRHVLATAVTDMNGEARVATDKGSVYAIVSAPEQGLAQAWARVDGGRWTVVPLARGGFAVAMVVDVNGHPVAGMVAGISQGNFRARELRGGPTDSGGIWKSRCLYPGDYLLTCRTPGHEEGVLVAAQVRVEAGKDAQATLRLPPMGTVAVRLQGEWPKELSLYLTRLWTAPDGYEREERLSLDCSARSVDVPLAVGTYKARWMANGMSSDAWTVSVTHADQRVELDPAPPEHRATVSLCDASGRLLGAGAAGVRLMIGTPLFPSVWVETGEQGAFTLWGVPPGDYNVRLLGPGESETTSLHLAGGVEEVRLVLPRPR